MNTKSKNIYNKRLSLRKLAACAAFGFCLSACSHAIDSSAVLQSYVDNTVVATYSKMSDSAIEFNAAASELKKSPSDENAEKAAKKWSQVRTYWEQGESFLFGPAAFANLDPNLDSWPLDQSQLDTLIKSINKGEISIDAPYIRSGLGAAFRGFHAAEYLLFRDGKVRKAADISKAELEYLAAVAQVLAEDCIALESWWKGADALSDSKAKILEAAEIETSGSYANEMKNAGKSGSRYASDKEAISEIFDGCIDIVDEIAESKIGTPAKTENPLECESRHSGSSLADIRDNIISVRNSYEGINSGGKNLSALVATKSEETDAEVKKAIKNTLMAVEGLKSPMFNNLKENKDGFKVAIEKCQNLSEVLAKAKGLVAE